MILENDYSYKTLVFEEHDQNHIKKQLLKNQLIQNGKVFMKSQYYQLLVLIIFRGSIRTINLPSVEDTCNGIRKNLIERIISF